MDHYEIWCDLAPGVKDLEFCRAVEAYLGHLKSQDMIDSFRIRRRKFGFGPSELGEFSITISTFNLAQLELAFNHAATRAGEVEALHVEVYSRVVNFRSGLYRDFPDAVRVQ